MFRSPKTVVAWNIGTNVVNCTGNRPSLDLTSIPGIFRRNVNDNFVTSKFDVNLILSLVAMVESLGKTSDMSFNITALGQVKHLQFKVGDLYTPAQSFVPSLTAHFWLLWLICIPLVAVGVILGRRHLRQRSQCTSGILWKHPNVPKHLELMTEQGLDLNPPTPPARTVNDQLANKRHKVANVLVKSEQP